MSKRNSSGNGQDDDNDFERLDLKLTEIDLPKRLDAWIAEGNGSGGNKRRRYSSLLSMSSQKPPSTISCSVFDEAVEPEDGVSSGPNQPPGDPAKVAADRRAADHRRRLLESQDREVKTGSKVRGLVAEHVGPGYEEVPEEALKAILQLFTALKDQRRKLAEMPLLSPLRSDSPEAKAE
eukprot:CAMPEP_0113708816 /NCGR_PEP_ID=MMETSP0038_2-20120614/29205_1 /TAXON_ID=2898 /ORGANISM="Cryptomonas paramecium" /LENGTH=178 /DNA_ID=CAMNT_0000634591 /DNA_START=315 /DNA_END=848 /DNA_ORIENTATION=+ /assembly_acc=CAM_ASM_000170